MNIIITLTGGGYHSYDLDQHRVEFTEGALWVSTDTAYLSDSKTVAVYSEGDWKRVEFDRLGVGQPRTIHDVRSGIDD
jgi:hypothetical protein